MIVKVSEELGKELVKKGKAEDIAISETLDKKIENAISVLEVQDIYKKCNFTDKDKEVIKKSIKNEFEKYTKEILHSSLFKYSIDSVISICASINKNDKTLLDLSKKEMMKGDK